MIQTIYQEQPTVESVKFQFINKAFLGIFTPQNKNILTSDELQGKGKVFNDAEELLSAILNNKQYKHSQHIQYLADKHENQTMKIRFELNPFSFVFLLAGEQRYYFVLKTLDTEEATYLWHTPKNKSSLIEKLIQIENQLNIIKEKGSDFKKSNPCYFKLTHLAG